MTRRKSGDRATNDFDARFDRRLREALEARRASTAAGPGGPECLDAETLAAWADGALRAQERAVVEAHAADCANCQALLAAFMKTTPASAAAKPWWRLSAATWLVPLTAAAAAILVWAIVPGRPGPARPAIEPGGRIAGTVDELAQLPARSDQAPADSKANAQPQEAYARPRQRETRDARRLQGNAKERQEVMSKIDTPSKDAAPSGNANPLAAPAEPTPNTVETAKPTQARAAPSPTPAPSSATSGAPPAGIDAGRVARGAAVGAAGASQAAAKRSESAVAPAFRAGAATEIISPDPKHRWRIASAGAVLHSIDGGMTWETQRTGEIVTLTAGSAPSASVCWLVGRGGSVLRTTDGRSWQRLAFPEPTDLVSIRATDDKTAMVTSADARIFTTVDGGLTWTLQENLAAPFQG